MKYEKINDSQRRKIPIFDKVNSKLKSYKSKDKAPVIYRIRDWSTRAWKNPISPEISAGEPKKQRADENRILNFRNSPRVKRAVCEIVRSLSQLNSVERVT